MIQAQSVCSIISSTSSVRSTLLSPFLDMYANLLSLSLKLKSPDRSNYTIGSLARSTLLNWVARLHGIYRMRPKMRTGREQCWLMMTPDDVRTAGRSSHDQNQGPRQIKHCVINCINKTLHFCLGRASVWLESQGVTHRHDQRRPVQHPWKLNQELWMFSFMIELGGNPTEMGVVRCVCDLECISVT